MTWSLSLALHLLVLAAAVTTSCAHTVGKNRSKRSVSRSATLWPGGEVPYVFASSFTASELAIINQIIDDFHQYTPVRFVLRSTQTYWIKFMYAQSSFYCGQSFVGREGGFAGVGQPLELNFQDAGCITSAQPGTVYHEIMHALGFEHEHQRTGRDECVSVGSHCGCGAVNFAEMSTNSYGQPYDYTSVMHYHAYSCTCDGSVVLTPLEPGVSPNVLGQSYWWTQIDVNKLNLMYSVTPPTIPTDPKWDAITCDGTVVTPAPPGSGENGICFHGDNWVMTLGGVKSVADVSVGDLVLSVDEARGVRYQPVYMVGKAWPDVDIYGQYVDITSVSGHTLRLTRRHLLYAVNSQGNVELVEAGSVTPTDNILVYSASGLGVTPIANVTALPHARGVYSLDVLGSAPIVSGVLASSHAAGIWPTLCRAGKWPIRMIYIYGWLMMGGTSKRRMPPWLAATLNYISHTYY